ncbi:hypothetical protein LX32DRAFT_255736 [Colletotrichum zoysiae]|uniref:Uncharacterized protein n=1 Tax=Colletotrichum zoysiae TaxID=1216348 RepID=A0AAD9HVE3_9PEZI|nr:hypothetical protein LX32DRAFT_255736 [Colletotrichum zoysiae]
MGTAQDKGEVITARKTPGAEGRGQHRDASPSLPLPPAVHNISLHLIQPAPPLFPSVLVMCFDRCLLRLFDFICTPQRNALHCCAGKRTTGNDSHAKDENRMTEPLGCTAQTTKPASPPLQTPDAATTRASRTSVFFRPAITHQPKVRLTTQATAVALLPLTEQFPRQAAEHMSLFSLPPHLPWIVAGVGYVCHPAQSRIHIHARTYARTPASSEQCGPSPDGRVRDEGCANLASLFYSSLHTHTHTHTHTHHTPSFSSSRLVRCISRFN